MGQLHAKEKVLLLFLFSIIGLSLFLESMYEWIDHDENVYIASGYLIQKGIHPILDYPYIHQPGFSLCYSFLFLLSDHLMMIARTFSALCTALILLLCWWMFRKHLFDREGFKGETYIMPIVFLLFGFFHDHLDPAILSWNYAFPALILLIAFFLQLKFMKERRLLWLVLSGFFFAFSVSVRASLAPLVIPLFLSVLILGWQQKRIVKVGLLYVLACLLGSLIVFGYMAKDFDAFMYDMFTFHREVDIQYLIDQDRARSVITRLNSVNKWYFNRSPLFLSLFTIALVVLRYFSDKKHFWKLKHAQILILSLWIFCIAMSFLKNVTFPQYMFLPLPFFLLFAYSLYADLPVKLRIWAVRLSLVVLVLMIIKEPNRIIQLRLVNKTELWFAYNAHQVEGKFIAENTKPGKILSLAPVCVLEAKREIYLPFVNGPFSYRTADWVPREKRLDRGIIGPGEIDSFVQYDRPVAVYVGWESRGLENELKAYAEKNGYQKIKTPFNKSLYVLPE